MKVKKNIYFIVLVTDAEATCVISSTLETCFIFHSKHYFLQFSINFLLILYRLII